MDFEVYKDGTELKAKLSDETDTSVAGIATDDDGNYIITVRNEPGKALPSTGGPGNIYSTCAGLLMMALFVVMCVIRTRRLRKEVET